MSARPTFLSAVTVLVRNPRDMIHRRDCRYAGRSRTLPWIWAEGKTRAEVKSAEVNGLRMCKVCRPLDALPTSVPTGAPS